MQLLYILLGIIIGILALRLRSVFTSNNSLSMFNLIFLALGILGGLAAAYFIFGNKFCKTDVEKITTNTIVQKIERVFKIVSAEGHFSEIYDYEQTEHLFSFIPSTKKALLVVNAKVLMGFDFKKFKYTIDQTTNKISIDSFPAPEILSIEPDIKYYNLENGLFNKFSKEDLTKLQTEAKQKIAESVIKSDLPSIAQKQMQHLLLEISSLQQWTLQGEEKILLPHANTNMVSIPEKIIEVSDK